MKIKNKINKIKHTKGNGCALHIGSTGRQQCEQRPSAINLHYSIAASCCSYAGADAASTLTLACAADANVRRGPRRRRSRCSRHFCLRHVLNSATLFVCICCYIFVAILYLFLLQNGFLVPCQLWLGGFTFSWFSLFSFLRRITETHSQFDSSLSKGQLHNIS